LAKACCHLFWGPLETITLAEIMIFIRTGRVVIKGLVLSTGDAWNHDNILLDSDWLKDRCQPKALTYVIAAGLTKAALTTVADRFPDLNRALRHAQIYLAVRRAFIGAAKVHRVEQAARSFLSLEEHCPTDNMPSVVKSSIRPSFTNRPMASSASLHLSSPGTESFCTSEGLTEFFPQLSDPPMQHEKSLGLLTEVVRNQERMAKKTGRVDSLSAVTFCRCGEACSCARTRRRRQSVSTRTDAGLSVNMLIACGGQCLGSCP